MFTRSQALALLLDRLTRLEGRASRQLPWNSPVFGVTLRITYLHIDRATGQVDGDGIEEDLDSIRQILGEAGFNDTETDGWIVEIRTIVIALPDLPIALLTERPPARETVML